RAGVSSFGIGGTNAHVIVEEAPLREASGPSRPFQLLVVSARTPSALDAATSRLATHLSQSVGAALPDIAYTLAIGRAQLEQRRIAVCRSGAEAAAALAAGETSEVAVAAGQERRPSV